MLSQLFRRLIPNHSWLLSYARFWISCNVLVERRHRDEVDGCVLRKGYAFAIIINILTGNLYGKDSRLKILIASENNVKRGPSDV
jgi:hypothetical protein